MIKYALRCDQAHGFEGWFSDSADYDEQSVRNLLSCPVCGSASVSKALMAPAVRTGRSKDAASEAARQAKLVAIRGEFEDKARKVRDYVHRNFEGVGEAFPEEARKIHYGEAEDRPIYGQATPKEARELAEEGVTVAPLIDPDAKPEPSEVN